MPKISLGDLEMNVVDQGRGTALLLVHGFPLDHQMWQGQIDGLSRHFRVLAPDLRGFGQSSPVSGTVTMRQFADDLAAMLESLRIGTPVVFCGLSMGGYVAWQFFLHHARHMAGLILCDTRAAADDQEAARVRLATADHVEREGVSALVETMVPKLFAPETIEHRPGMVRSTQQVMLATDPRTVAAAQRGMAARPDVRDQLHRMDIPALFICGRQDVISPVDEMRGIADAMPQARFVEVPGAGHMAPLEQPSFVNNAIRQFVEKLGSSLDPQ